VCFLIFGTFKPAGSSMALGDAPAFCRVQARLVPAAASLINFEVWTPDTWNGKIVFTGIGGYSNAPGWRDGTEDQGPWTSDSGLATSDEGRS
jgi:hypothetical protein